MNRVLVVDDKPENVYLLRALFEGHGFAVQEARHGAEALVLARQTPPDIVVSDLLMPVMDGYTLLRHWKADGRLNRAPFVVYTATYTDPQDERLALDLGADAFVLKPAEPGALLECVQEAIGRTARRVRPAADGGSAEDEEAGPLETYNRVLIRKLEEKMLELETANRALEEDVQMRIRAQRQLEQAASLLRIAGRAAQVGAWVLELPDRVLVWSEETCAMHGLPRGHRPTLDEAAGFCLPGSRETFARAVTRCADAGAPFDLELQIENADGRRLWVRTVGEAVRDDRGDVVRVQGAIQDISERKILEQQFFRAQRMEVIAALTGGMAHDLNNVLSPILLSADLMAEGALDDEERESLETIQACAQRGAEMVRQVLSFARGLGSGPSSVNLLEVVRDVERVVRETFPDSIALRAEVEEDLAGLEGDPTQLHQVLMNLVMNARDALLPGGGRIEIRIRNREVALEREAAQGQAHPGRYVEVAVADTGHGMTPEVCARIFEPLFTTKPEGKGTGLGLSTVAAIVRNHRGFLDVTSQPEGGTEFRLCLPVTHEAAASVPSVVPVEDPLLGQGEAILLVDEEGAVRSIMEQALEAFGYRVCVAGGGAEAMRLVADPEEAIALVLADCGIAGARGEELLEGLRRVRPDLPIVAVAESDDTAVRARAREAGASAFLRKPYTVDVLLSTVRASLGAVPT